MNTEVLLAVLQDLVRELDETSLGRWVKELDDSFAQMARQPGQAQHQQTASSALSRLDVATSGSWTNTADAIQRSVLEEVGLWELTGARLQERVTAAVEGRELVPARVAEELSPMRADFESRVAGARSIVTGMASLDLAALAPSEGSAFLRVSLAPRDGYGLRVTAQELEQIHFVARTAALYGGSPAPVEIVSWSASELALVIEIVREAVPFLASAIGLADAVIQRIEKKRELRDGAREAELSPGTIEALELEVEQAWDTEVARAVETMTTDIGTALADRNDRVDIEVRVKKTVETATRLVDQGHHFQIQIGPSADDPEDEAAIEQAERLEELADSLPPKVDRPQPIRELERPVEDDPDLLDETDAAD